MTTYWTSKGLTLLHGDCREVMRSLPEQSVQVCVTSPPYFGLRSYEGVEPSVWGDGDELCAQPSQGGHQWRDDGGCDRLCGAWRGHLGLEPTPELYVQHIVEVFREVWRVLRDDATLFLNLGDKRNKKNSEWLGIPHDVRKALQGDGWLFADEIVWRKPNPMPESVTRRTTRSHEYIFLLTKKPRYFFDCEAVREKGQEWTGRAGTFARDGEVACHVLPGQTAAEHRSDRTDRVAAGRNLRSVWTIPTQTFAKAHFATFPEKLVATCLKAGTSSKGCCPECGTPWRRVVEKSSHGDWHGRKGTPDELGKGQVGKPIPADYVCRTIGWEPGCGCYANYATSGLCDQDQQPHAVIPCTVLDPFVGSGTTLAVAKQLGLHGIGIDASAKYLDMAKRRIENPRPEPEAVQVAGQDSFAFEE